jgi:hypothetical protein
MADDIRLNLGVDGDLVAAEEDGGKKYQVIRVDGYDTTHDAVVTLDEIHSSIHKGRMFSSGYHSMSVADNADIEILVQVGATAAHALLSVAVGGDAEAELYEGTTFSGAGTAATPVNKNRFSATAATTTVTHTPTLTLDGTLLASGYIPGGTKAQSGGGTGSSFAEWVLQTSTDYLIRLINRAGSTQPLGIVIDFYEPA